MNKLNYLNKLHQSRWNFARSLFQKIIETATREKAMLSFNGSLIDVSSIKITDTKIYIIENKCTFVQFDANPSYDHGLYDTIQETEARIRESFVILKPVRY